MRSGKAKHPSLAAARLILPVLAVSLAAGLLSGCMQSVRLKDRAIVQAVGVDYQDGKFKLTFQYFIPEGGGGQTTFDASKLNNNIIQSEGETMTLAVEDASRNQGRRLFFGSNKVIILGKSMAENGIKKAIDYFNANHQLHPSVFVLVAENSASEIVSAQISRGIVPASAIEQAAQNAYDLHHLSGGRMLDVVTQLENGQKTVDIPIIKIESDEKKPEILIKSAALFKDGVMCDTLSEPQVEGALWLNGKMDKTQMMVELPGGEKCALQLLFTRCTKRPRVTSQGAIGFTIEIRTDSALREVISGDDGNVQKELIQSVEEMQAKKIRQLVSFALDKAVTEHQADIFNLLGYVRKYEPDFYNAHEDDLDGMLQRMAFQIEVDCNISRIGLSANDAKKNA